MSQDSKVPTQLIPSVKYITLGSICCWTPLMSFRKTDSFSCRRTTVQTVKLEKEKRIMPIPIRNYHKRNVCLSVLLPNISYRWTCSIDRMTRSNSIWCRKKRKKGENHRTEKSCWIKVRSLINNIQGTDLNLFSWTILSEHQTFEQRKKTKRFWYFKRI